jgi:branched-subunit amino acid transport protein AzlD
MVVIVVIIIIIMVGTFRSIPFLCNSDFQPFSTHDTLNKALKL